METVTQLSQNRLETMSKSQSGGIENDRNTSNAPPSSNMVPNSEVSDTGFVPQHNPIQMADINIPGPFSGKLTSSEKLSKSIIDNLDSLQTTLH
jgi:hypothetical protein